jgi:hypothetical protein
MTIRATGAVCIRPIARKSYSDRGSTCVHEREDQVTRRNLTHGLMQHRARDTPEISDLEFREEIR